VAEWDSGINVHRECPYRKRVKILVDITALLLAERLSKRYNGLEWLFYMKKLGEIDLGDTVLVIVGDPMVPRQTVTTASVDVNDAVPAEYNVVAHCHPMDYNDFSGTDDRYINANNDISLLYRPGKGFVKAVARQKMPCGIYMAVDAEIAGVALLGTIKDAVEKADALAVSAEEKISYIMPKHEKGGKGIVYPYYDYNYYAQYYYEDDDVEDDEEECCEFEKEGKSEGKNKRRRTFY